MSETSETERTMQLLRTTESDNAIIVALIGAVIEDLAQVEPLCAALEALGKDNREQHLVFDLEDVRCISSQTLGAIVSLRRQAAQHGKHVVFSRAREELERLFKLTNLDRLFKFFESNEAALEYLKSRE